MSASMSASMADFAIVARRASITVSTTAESASTFSIGAVNVGGRLAAAPMAGISDNAYRQVAKRFGCDLVCTEMLSSEALVRNSQKTERLLRFDEFQRPISAQIVGSRPDVMADAAAMLEALGFDLIDINVGCAVPKVLKCKSGVALMREPKLLSEIINHVARAVRAPVTVKMRAGYDRSTPDCGFVARLAEDFGAKAVTIHPRRGSDQFRGEADWSLIARAKAAVGIPVIGNGDVDGPEAALRMIEETGCDAVMVGRAALGHPWVFRDIAAALNGGPVNGARPERQEVGEVLLWHYRMSALSSPDDPVRRFRKFAAWYSRRFPGSVRFRKWVNSVRTDAAFRAAVVDFFGVSDA